SQEEVVAGGQILEELPHLLGTGIAEVEQRGEQLAGEEQGGGCVAAVELVAHVQRSAHDRTEGHTASGAHRFTEQGADHVLDGGQASSHVVVPHTVVQSRRRRALEEIAEPAPAPGAVLDDEYGHGGGVDAGHRAHAPVIVAGLYADSSTGKTRDGGGGIRR